MTRTRLTTHSTAHRTRQTPERVPPLTVQAAVVLATVAAVWLAAHPGVALAAAAAVLTALAVRRYAPEARVTLPALRLEVRVTPAEE